MRAVTSIAGAVLFATCVAACSGGEAPAAVEAADAGCPRTLAADDEDGAPAAFAFRYVSFFEGDPSALVELAPDEMLEGAALTQVWNFPPPPRDEAIVMLCRYRETEAVLRIDIPDEVSSCTLRGRFERGEIVGSPSLACQ